MIGGWRVNVGWRDVASMSSTVASGPANGRKNGRNVAKGAQFSVVFRDAVTWKHPEHPLKR